MGRFEAKTSLKGQTTIPIEVRKALGLPPGGSLQFIVDDSKVSVVAKKSDLSHLRGIFGRPDKPVDIEEAIMETLAEKSALSRSNGDK